MLPNGGIYGMESLIEASLRGDVLLGKVRESPTTGEVRKLYISIFFSPRCHCGGYQEHKGTLSLFAEVFLFLSAAPLRPFV